MIKYTCCERFFPSTCIGRYHTKHCVFVIEMFAYIFIRIYLTFPCSDIHHLSYKFIGILLPDFIVYTPMCFYFSFCYYECLLSSSRFTKHIETYTHKRTHTGAQTHAVIRNIAWERERTSESYENCFCHYICVVAFRHT